MISAVDLHKHFGDIRALNGVTQEIVPGEKVVIVGPSGCGKSTFLRCLNLLELPTMGEIWFDGTKINEKGVDIDRVRHKMGMVFQQFNLFPHKTILENIMLAPVKLLNVPKQKAFDDGLKYLEMVGLAQKAYAYPDELSGGQKQQGSSCYMQLPWYGVSKLQSLSAQIGNRKPNRSPNHS